MSTSKPNPPENRQALRAAIVAHDSAAMVHMKAAEGHLRASRQLAQRLEQPKRQRRA